MELQSWTNELILPTSIWLPGFFNPQSFLTAVMQSTARKNELPLDKMTLITDVTPFTCRDALAYPPKGCLQTFLKNIQGIFPPF